MSVNRQNPTKSGSAEQPSDRPEGPWTVRRPNGPEEWVASLDLRWRVLRAPWNQPRGSEADDLDSAADHLVAIDPAGRVIGTARLHLRDASTAQVRFLAVEADFRGQGVGLALLSGLEQVARERGIQRCVLEARTVVSAFYERGGYRVVGPGKCLFGTVPHVWMEKPL